MTTKEISASSDSNSFMNISSSVNPMLLEHEIRAAAQQALAQAVVRSAKLAFSNISAVLRDAAKLQQQHGSKIRGAV